MTNSNRGSRSGVAPPGSVSRWIEEIKGGSETVIPSFWNRYFKQLEELARARMVHASSRAVGGDDIASTVLEVVCRKLATGNYPAVRDRDDLWRLLERIAKHKIISHIRHERSQKRGQGRVVLETDLRTLPDEIHELDEQPDGEATIESLVVLEEAFRKLVDGLLADEIAKDVLRLKMLDYENDEIAEKIDKAKRTVERKVKKIFNLWARQAGMDVGDDDEDPNSTG